MTGTSVPTRAAGPLDQMRAAHERRLEHEGIPMILALDDARPRAIAVDPAPTENDERYAELVDHYRERLAPWARDDDQGAVINVLQVISFTSFTAPVSPVDIEGV